MLKYGTSLATPLVTALSVGVATNWDMVLVSLVTQGCVHLASLGLPRGAHSAGEPFTRATRTITQQSRSDVVYLGPAPK